MSEVTPVQQLMTLFGPQALNELAYALNPPQFAPRAPTWGKVRGAHIRKNPSCAACGGREHLQVHHIQPYHLFPEKELDPANLLTLCQHPARLCHFVFGHLYDWAAWNPEVTEYATNHLKLIQHRKYGA